MSGYIFAAKKIMTKKINQMAVRYRSLADGDGIAFKWESSLNKILTVGNYAVEIEHYGADVGLPIEACGTEHSIVGTLVVTDSGALENKQGDRVMGQVLTFTLRESKETSIYTRTYAGGGWSEWCSLARTGMYDEITNADALYSTVTSLASKAKELEENLHASIINYNEWKDYDAELSLPNVLTDDEFVKMVKSGTILTFKNTSTTWKRFQYTAESTAATDVRNYSNWKELSGAVYGIKQAIDAEKVTVKGTSLSGEEVATVDIPAATTENAGVMSAEDKKLLQYGCGGDRPVYYVTGYVQSSNGNISSNENYRATDFIRLNKNEPLVIIGGESSSAALVAFYDANKKHILNYNNVSEITIMPGEYPEDAVFYRSSVINRAVDTIKLYNATNYDMSQRVAALEVFSETATGKLGDMENRIPDIISNSLLLVADGYYNSAGAFAATESARNTGLVEIGGYSKLHYSTNMGSTAAAVCFFDESKTCIPELSVPGVNSIAGGVIELSDGKYAAAKYVAVSYYDAKKVYKDYKALLYNDGSLDSRVENVEKRVTNTEGGIAKLESRTSLVEGYLEDELSPVTTIAFPNVGYIAKDGKIYGTDNYSRHSDKIPMRSILEIYSSAIVGNIAYSVIFYNAAGDVISGVEGNPTTPVGTLTFTEEQLTADSFRVQFYANSESVAQARSVCYVTRYARRPIAVRVESVENIKKIMPPVDAGLKVLIFGDSITNSSIISVNELQQTTKYELLENSNSYVDELGQTVRFSMWPFLMTRYISCSDVRNYALSGASYTERERESGSERQNLSYQVQLALNDRTNPNGVFPTDGDFVPDVVIFALGTNDGAPNDTYESAMAKTVTLADGKTFDVEATLAHLDITKTCEAIRYAFLKVKQAFPQSLCLCVLPIQRADMENPGINDALEKMAKRYSIKVIDGYSELGIVRDLEEWNGFGTNLKDGLHPNDKGQKLYTRMMVNAIKNNWLDIEL